MNQALGGYPGSSPLLKDEAYMAQRGEITYSRSQSKFLSGLMLFIYHTVPHYPKIVGKV